MSKGYEERYLITLLSAILNQKPSPELLRQPDWDKMFRLADYHNVAHAVYYGIMGLNVSMPQAIRQRFFNKYLEAVHRTGRLRTGENQVLALLERNNINCFVLRYSDIVKCYPIEEMCCREFIEIGTDKKNEWLISKILENVDFEERKTEGRGHLYYRIPGTRVLCYNHSIFFSRPMCKYFKSLLTILPHRKGYKHVREMTPDDQYIFLMSRLTDSYARGEICLNQIMDFWVFYKKYGEVFSWPYIYEKLNKLKIAEFSERLEYLILRWFGSGAGIENTEIYDAMESYILTRGSEGREISAQLLPLIKTVADCYARDRRTEKLKKVIEWLFPDRRYMETIYPSLGNLEYLLPFFWLIRLGRYVIRIVSLGVKEKVLITIVGIFPFLKSFGAWIKNRRLIKQHKDMEHIAKKVSKRQNDEQTKNKTAEIPK
ncbi:hypothetical protein BN3590_04496 [Clostridium sp. C105KSO15]|nr:hypothetical protein BN3590_04496 [Clostridium sp. C105KSO15]